MRCLCQHSVEGTIDVLLLANMFVFNTSSFGRQHTASAVDIRLLSQCRAISLATR